MNKTNYEEYLRDFPEEPMKRLDPYWKNGISPSIIRTHGVYRVYFDYNKDHIDVDDLGQFVEEYNIANKFHIILNGINVFRYCISEHDYLLFGENKITEIYCLIKIKIKEKIIQAYKCRSICYYSENDICNFNGMFLLNENDFPLKDTRYSLRFINEEKNNFTTVKLLDDKICFDYNDETEKAVRAIK